VTRLYILSFSLDHIRIHHAGNERLMGALTAVELSLPFLTHIIELSLINHVASTASLTKRRESARQGYIPTETDVLRARQKNTGITETCFNMNFREYVAPAFSLSSIPSHLHIVLGAAY
jgi:hypothetical protein